MSQGEKSEAYRKQLAVADQLIAASSTVRASSEPPAAALRREVEKGLSQVGYHKDEIHTVKASADPRDRERGEPGIADLDRAEDQEQGSARGIDRRRKARACRNAAPGRVATNRRRREDAGQSQARSVRHVVRVHHQPARPARAAQAELVLAADRTLPVRQPTRRACARMHAGTVGSRHRARSGQHREAGAGVHGRSRVEGNRHFTQAAERTRRDAPPLPA
jgi:hypothetical protein